MPKGDHVKKGMRFGGRAKGTPNKAKVEQVERERLARVAAAEVDLARRKAIKLGKEVLEEYMVAFASIAAVYQNRVVNEFKASREPSKTDLKAFEKWGHLTAQTAYRVAEFQSPKFKSIALNIPQPSPMRTIEGSVNVDKNDPVAAQRAYEKMMKAVA